MCGNHYHGRDIAVSACGHIICLECLKQKQDGNCFICGLYVETLSAKVIEHHINGGNVRPFKCNSLSFTKSMTLPYSLERLASRYLRLEDYKENVRLYKWKPYMPDQMRNAIDIIYGHPHW
ncbi:MAG: RING finger family 4 domain-containing protein [Candidatus Roizmanbacteria bacterium]